MEMRASVYACVCVCVCVCVPTCADYADLPLHKSEVPLISQAGSDLVQCQGNGNAAAGCSESTEVRESSVSPVACLSSRLLCNLKAG